MEDAASPASLWHALDLASAPVPVVAVVGGGGKTALLYRLGVEAQTRGLRAVLGGTARFTPASAGVMPPLVTAEDSALPAAVSTALGRDPVVVASTGDGPQGRLEPMSPATAEAISRLPGLGLLALEADGSKMRPFKAPGDHEPVVPAVATHVVAVVGLDALDAPLDDAHVHRPERVRALVGDVACCTAEVIARVVASTEGGRKGVGERAFAVLVNKADLDEARGEALAAALREAGIERVVLGSLRDRSMPVRAVYS